MELSPKGGVLEKGGGTVHFGGRKGEGGMMTASGRKNG